MIAAVPRGGATWNYLDGIAELVEAGNPQFLAEKIEELVQNPSRCKYLAKLGLDFATQNLDSETGRSRYLKWVTDLVGY